MTRTLRRSMARVGRAWDAKGNGNSTRRIRLEVSGVDADTLQRALGS